MTLRSWIKLAFVVLLPGLPSCAFGQEVSFRPVARLFAEHCLDCHSAEEPEGQLVLDSHASLMKGGESGPAIIPGKSSESMLVKMVEGTFEVEGKTRVMPPGRRKKLTPEEVAIIKGWVDGGALAPAEDGLIAKEIVAPRIEPRIAPPEAIHALAYDPAGKILAVARPGAVELHSAEDQLLMRRLEGHKGEVNAVVFSPDGKSIYAAGGEHGVSGVVTHWNTANGELQRTFDAHKDTVFGLAVSPDGKMLATGSYDQKIKLWKSESGEELRSLTGHNGCVYALAFRPDGKILASASGDRTVKLWDVERGERRETLSQPLKELYTVAFSPVGKRLAAAGVDNRIRVWEISETAAETTNPLIYSKFGHEGSILRVVFSADGKQLASSAEDKTLKLWDATEMEERRALEKQPDWAPGLAFVLEGRGLAAGRVDGSLEYYNTAEGSVLNPPAPEVVRAEPRGIQRGVTTRVRLTGKHLHQAQSVSFSNADIKAVLAENASPRADEVWVEVAPAPVVGRGSYELRVQAAGGESKPVTLHVDDLPQYVEGSSADGETVELPATIWGAHERSGEVDRFRFKAEAGEVLVFDAAGKSIGSKADLVLRIEDASGKVLASANGSASSPDPLLAWTAPEAGEFMLVVSELVLGGSAEHFYRVSAGSFPYVTAWFPAAIREGEEREVELAGYNLPEQARTMARAPEGKGTEFSLDAEKYRFRREAKLTRIAHEHTVESEPNDTVEKAMSIPAPGGVSGRIWQSDSETDEDWFRFEAGAGESWIIETMAGQLESPLDTKIEILDVSGARVVRTMLQAVRNSAITFRPIDSITMDCRVEHWEEMELNELLYMQGEVVKLFRAPQGPDSGFLFYGLNGKRRTYFDTTPTTHANEEPCYIVEPHPPGAQLVPTGLPVFPVHFENDDDGERRLGTDSRVYFTPRKTGTYLVRVTDTRRFAGPDYNYLLLVRKAEPDFKVTLGGANPRIAPGSGGAFTLSAERVDGFEGEIRVEISNVPEGFTVSNPIVIQAGHTSASGSVFAAADAIQPAGEHKITVRASGLIEGKTVEREVNSLGRITLAEKAPLYVTLEPIGGSAREITIAPGGTVAALLKIRRNGHDERVTFTVDNLPHGIIVDNIGLNGVLIPPDQNEREIFLTAAKWVPETDRLCHAVSNEAGRQASLPLLVKVRKAAGQIAGR